ncbi:MAG: hypothetical protein GC190_02805 [Alphaproteobacteria bacterium]|nr:hypothetical protein [Alphaproteobacteria bacterium]
MRTITGASIAALAFGLGFAATPVFAADYGHGQDRNDQTNAQQQDQNQNGKSDKHRHRDRRDDAKSQNGRAPSGMNKADWQKSNNVDDQRRSRDDASSDRHDRRDDFNRNHRNDHRWDRNRPKINVEIYRRNITSPRRYHIGAYRAPRDYHYRRWHYGDRLPIAFYARSYWLLDYIAFGLFAPPPGYVWVRYGPDALLIDVETGEIIQVRYDVFYS